MQNDRLASLANFAETISTPSPTPVVPAPTGFQSQDLQEFYQTKDYDKLGRAAVRAVGGGLRSTVSLIAAATGYGGLVALGASVAGNKFEEEFEKDPMQSTGSNCFSNYGHTYKRSLCRNA